MDWWAITDRDGILGMYIKAQQLPWSTRALHSWVWLHGAATKGGGPRPLPCPSPFGFILLVVEWGRAGSPAMAVGRRMTLRRTTAWGQGFGHIYQSLAAVMSHSGGVKRDNK